MAKFVCKGCGNTFNKKLTLKQKSESLILKFCCKKCAENYRFQEIKLAPKTYRIPKSSKEERVFGEIVRSFFPKLESQYRIPNKDHHYDFYSPELKMIIEYDGEFWHNKPKQRLKDRKYLNEATKAKIKLAVVTDKEWKIFMDSGLPSKKKLLMLLQMSIKNENF